VLIGRINEKLKCWYYTSIAPALRQQVRWHSGR
jgi:hypothetical protein